MKPLIALLILGSIATSKHRRPEATFMGLLMPRRGPRRHFRGNSQTTSQSVAIKVLSRTRADISGRGSAGFGHW